MIEMVTFDTFHNVCVQQGVELDPRIISSGQGINTLPYCYTPTDVLTAVAGASALARNTPGANLANKAISGKPWENDLAARTLQHIINGSVAPLSNTAPQTTFTSDKTSKLNTCLEAEYRFIELFRSLQRYASGSAPITAILKGELFVANNGPLMIRKFNGQPSTLTLNRIVVNGIPYPPGSIVGIITRRDLEESAKSSSLIITSARNIATIGLLRLSAFAERPKKRTEVFSELLSYPDISRAERRFAQVITLARLRTIAMSAMLKAQSFAET